MLKKKPAAVVGRLAANSRSSTQCPRDSQHGIASKARPSNYSPADARPALADDRGEDDWAFFRARPGATIRTRLPFPNEFPADFIACGGGAAFVRVAVTRDDRGLPVWASRNVMFCIQGGNA